MFEVVLIGSAALVALAAFVLTAVPRRLLAMSSVFVAAAFKGTASFTDGKGEPVATYGLSFSDVLNAFATNDGDGLTFVDLPKEYPNGRPIAGGVYLEDLFLTAAGTDTSQIEVWSGGFPSMHRLKNSAMSSAANVKRTPRIGFKPGKRVAFKQL